MNAVEVVDCTLRDGAYVIDFQFTAEDTRQIVGSLAKAGVRWIEVGHGLGLGAQPRHGQAAATDEEYVEAAVAAASGAKVGCFYIAGLGKPEQMKRARSLGMDFIRIGNNAPEVEMGLADITAARDMGLFVSSNLMKSYLLSPREIAECARKVEAAGAHLVTLVDSAGGMLLDEVDAYTRAIREAVSIPVGFHGHDNLGLANGASIGALRAGARFMDSTLQGMGRSAGNACTETLLLLYERLGIATGIDYYAVMELGERLIRPRLGRAGISGIQAVSGYAQFHSSFMKHVNEAAVVHGVDRRKLIVEVSRIDRMRPSRELFLEVAARLEKEQGGRDEALATAAGEKEDQ